MSNNCIVTGGEYQIFVSSGLAGPPTGVEVRGITFNDPSAIGIVTYGDNIETKVTECSFSGAKAEDVIGIYANGVGNVLTIRDSLFDGNLYMTAVGGVAGSVDIISTLFVDNIVAGAESIVGSIDGGTIRVSESCFIDNTVRNATGTIYADSASAMTMPSGNNINDNTNFGFHNVPILTPTTYCHGMRNVEGCVPFGSSYCRARPNWTPSVSPSAAPSPSPSNSPTATPTAKPTVTESNAPTDVPTLAPSPSPSASPSSAPIKPWCYSDWAILVLDVFDAAVGTVSSNGDTTYKLCPNTLLDASSKPLYIWDSDTVIQCGEHGHVSDNCTIADGDYQIFVADHPNKGAPKGIKIQGLTFTRPNIASIVSYGDGKSQARIVDCLFEGTDNPTAVSVYVGSPSMSEDPSLKNEVLVKKSIFRHNRFMSALGNVGGVLVVEDTLFYENDVSGTEGLFGVINTGHSSIITSCMIDNRVANATGIAYADGTSTWVFNEDNYAVGTDDGAFSLLPFCHGTYAAGSSSCVPFTATHCMVYPELTPSAAPTSNPTDSPSHGPSSAPSFSPSDQPSSIPTPMPTTAAPSMMPTGERYQFEGLNAGENAHGAAAGQSQWGVLRFGVFAVIMNAWLLLALS